MGSTVTTKIQIRTIKTKTKSTAMLQMPSTWSNSSKLQEHAKMPKMRWTPPRQRLQT